MLLLALGDFKENNYFFLSYPEIQMQFLTFAASK